MSDFVPFHGIIIVHPRLFHSVLPIAVGIIFLDPRILFFVCFSLLLLALGVSFPMCASWVIQQLVEKSRPVGFMLLPQAW